MDKVLLKIMDFALKDERIRAVILGGSRVNSNAPIDIFQDYDVCCVVTNPLDFYQNQEFISEFGELLIKQVNPTKGEKLLYGDAEQSYQSFIFLMLFKEGFRIDLTVAEEGVLEQEIYTDSLSRVLLDKDGIVKPLAYPNESSYYIKKPTRDEFDFVTNEFFWCLTNIAKGIYRDEITYVKSMDEMVVKKVFLQMIKWYIGVNHNWQVNPGKFGKWFKKYLSAELYKLLLSAYSDSTYDNIWDALFCSIELFRNTGCVVAQLLGYLYPASDDSNVTNYLRQVQIMCKEKNKTI